MSDRVVMDGQSGLNIDDCSVLILPAEDAIASINQVFDSQYGIVTEIGSPYPVYEGPVTVTPAATTQILETENTTVLSNIEIGPIPDNYGLITWDGSVLIVS